MRDDLGEERRAKIDAMERILPFVAAMLDGSRISVLLGFGICRTNVAMVFVTGPSQGEKEGFADLLGQFLQYDPKNHVLRLKLR